MPDTAWSYDQRRFGQLSTGYDYGMSADDLRTVFETLDLRDVILVWFSMGRGEIAQCIARYDEECIAKITFLASLEPYLPSADDNLNGAVPMSFSKDRSGRLKDRYAYFANLHRASPISTMTSARGFRRSRFGRLLAPTPALGHHLRRSTAHLADGLPRGNPRWRPALIVHIMTDKILLFDATCRRFKKGLPHGEYVRIRVPRTASA